MAANLNSNANSFVALDNYAAFFSGRADALGQIVLTDAPGIGEANLNGFQPIAAVPEPASWAMTIVGIGTIGAVMRRRRANGYTLTRPA